MTAVRPLQTEQELRGGASSARMLRRGATLVGIIVMPIAALIALGVAAALSRQHRIRPLLYVAGGTAVLVAVLLTGPIRPYLQPATDVAGAVAGLGLATVPPVGTVTAAVAQLAAERWAGWLAGMLPLSVAVGVFAGAVWAALRSRRRAVWRDTPLDQTPASADVVAKALKAMPTWPAPAWLAEHRAGQWAERWTRGRRRGRSGPTAAERHPAVGQLRLPLGVETTGTTPVYSLSISELGYHTYLDGPTGFGKTTTILEVCAGVVEQPAARRANNPLVFLTMKPDPHVTRALRTMATGAGRRFWHVTQNGVGLDGEVASTYSSFGRSGPYEIASAVLACLENGAGGGFTEPHHREAGDRFLKFAARAMHELHQIDPDRYQVDYATLAKLMHPQAITAERDRFSPQLGNAWEAYTGELTLEKDLSRSISGLRQRVANAAEGGGRDVLCAGPDSLQLEDAIQAGDVVVFDLDAAIDRTASQLIGNLAIQDLTATLARLGTQGWQHWRDADGQLVLDEDREPIQRRHCQIVVDEFSALGGTLVDNLFRRSRGHGAGLLLATQEKGGLVEVSPGFAETVITNADVLIVHIQSINAEFYAELFGTRTVFEESSQIFEEGTLVGQNIYKSGQGNLRQVEKFTVHPNVLRSLGRGQVVIRVKSRQGEAPRRVQIRRSFERRHRDHALAAGASPVTEQHPTATSTTSTVAESADTQRGPANPYVAAAAAGSTVAAEHASDGLRQGGGGTGGGTPSRRVHAPRYITADNRPDAAKQATKQAAQQAARLEQVKQVEQTVQQPTDARTTSLPAAPPAPAAFDPNDWSEELGDEWIDDAAAPSVVETDDWPDMDEQETISVESSNLERMSHD